MAWTSNLSGDHDFSPICEEKKSIISGHLLSYSIAYKILFISSTYSNSASFIFFLESIKQDFIS
jgi:hypothetical protein